METENKTELTRTPAILSRGVPAALGLCLCAIFLYAAGSGFSEEALFVILRVLQFLAVLLAALSLCALAFNLWRAARFKRFRYALFAALYLASGIAGAALMFAGGFIASAAGGN